MSTKLLSLLLLSCFLFVSACDSNDDGGNGGDNDDDNAASVEVSGPIDGTYPGFATFVSVAGISHAITILLDDDKGTAILTAFGIADEGTYTIGEATEAGVFSVQVNLVDLEAVDGIQSGLVLLTEGTVTITDRDNDKIAGRFSGSGKTLLDEATVNLSGEFVSRCFAALGLCTIGG